MVTKSLEQSMKKICKRQTKEEFRTEKVIKKKRNKVHVKWKGFYKSFNSWIDEKDLV